MAELEFEPGDSLAGSELIPDTSSSNGEGVRRKGRGTFGGGGGTGSGRFALEPLASSSAGVGFELAGGVDPNARIAVRYATETDSDLRKEAKQSEWYKRHGRRAGKEVATAPRSTRREEREDVVVSFEGRGSGEGREFAKRIGKERRAGSHPYARGGRKSERELDRELDGMRGGFGVGNGAENGMDIDVNGMVGEGRGGGRRRNVRGRESRGKEDLDRGEIHEWDGREGADAE